MAERSVCMKWGFDQITPEKIDWVAEYMIQNNAQLNTWKDTWYLLNDQLKEDKLTSDTFKQAVEEQVFPLFYLAEATTKTTDGLFNIREASLDNIGIQFTRVSAMAAALSELSVQFNESTAAAFKKVSEGSGANAILRDASTKLARTLPRLDYVKLTEHGNSDRLWFAQQDNIIYAHSQTIDAFSPNGKREHESLVLKLNGLPRTRFICDLAFCNIEGFQNELFFVS